MLKMPLKPISTTYKQMYSIIIVHDSFRHFWKGNVNISHPFLTLSHL